MTSGQDLLTFDQFITHWAEDRPSLIAMREDGRAQSWVELAKSTAKVAAALQNAGLKKGDHIAWLGKNSDLYYTLFYGAARLGVVMVPVGWRLAPPEWTYIINDTGARLLFTGPGFEAAGASIKGDLSTVEQILKACFSCIRPAPRATPRA
jgi:acyl-CoA synthetase (AMP-forming)/AMP-acid ligase II